LIGLSAAAIVRPTMNLPMSSRPSPPVGGLALAAVILISFAESPSRAADSTDAEALIRQGVDLRSNGKDERALPLFQQAYKITRTPRTAGQLGLAEMSLGYLLEAESHLNEAMESPAHPWVLKNHTALVEALNTLRGKIGEVLVEGQPAGAEVRMNGRLVGGLPLAGPVRIAEGRVEVELSAPGYVSSLKVISVAGGTKQAVRISLERESRRDDGASASSLSNSPPAPMPHPETAVSVQPSELTPMSPVLPEHQTASVTASPPSPRNQRRMLAYLTGGGALAALVLGGVETARWHTKQTSFDDHLGPGPGGDPTMAALFRHDCGAADPMRGGAGCKDLYDSAQQARTLAIVGYAIGAALAGGAAALFVTSDARNTSRDQAAACFADPATRAAGCRWSF
jgi:hypothetical protein